MWDTSSFVIFLSILFLICLQQYLNIYTCNCHFLQALYSPNNQLMIYKYERITCNNLFFKGYVQHSLDFPVPIVNICIF